MGTFKFNSEAIKPQQTYLEGGRDLPPFSIPTLRFLQAVMRN
jgi:hypothetical protein